MALWMEAGSEAVTEKEKMDLDALDALKDAATIELKEQGNAYVKMGGSKNYKAAIDCYSRAIEQKAPGLADEENSPLFCNRAQVNLLLGNYRRALDDAQRAIQLDPSNLKGYYRAAKAASSLNLLNEAATFCEMGIMQYPSSQELNKLLEQVQARILENDFGRAKVSQAISAAKDLASAIEKKGLRLGKATYQELTGIRKPKLDEHGMIHWPVLLLYPEVMSSDFIEDFPETDSLSSHLNVMFSESSPPLPWDKDHAYTREAVELYYQDSVGTLLSKGEVLKYLLEGTVGPSALAGCISEATDGGDEMANETLAASRNFGKWVMVNERNSLLKILQQPQYVIPAIPVFLVVSKKSTFYDKFKNGNWSLP